MQRGLWLAAIVFASFLIGLGSALVGDLPQAEKQRTTENFMDADARAALRTAIKMPSARPKKPAPHWSKRSLKPRSPRLTRLQGAKLSTISCLPGVPRNFPTRTQN